MLQVTTSSSKRALMLPWSGGKGVERASEAVLLQVPLGHGGTRAGTTHDHLLHCYGLCYLPGIRWMSMHMSLVLGFRLMGPGAQPLLYMLAPARGSTERHVRSFNGGLCALCKRLICTSQHAMQARRHVFAFSEVGTERTAGGHASQPGSSSSMCLVHKPTSDSIHLRPMLNLRPAGSQKYCVRCTEGGVWGRVRKHQQAKGKDGWEQLLECETSIQAVNLRGPLPSHLSYDGHMQAYIHACSIRTGAP